MDIRSTAELYDIVAVATALLGELKKGGKGVKALCPFHPDTRPSFYVYKDRQRFCCFGCGASGDVVDLVGRVKGLTAMEACDWLGANMSDAQTRQTGTVPPWVEGTPEAADEARAILRTNELALKFFTSALWAKGQAARAARDYLTDRELLSLRMWHPGYAPPEPLAERFPDMIPSLKQAGLVYDDGRNVFEQRVVWPVMTCDGHPAGFVGRALGDAQPKYLNTEQNRVYRKGEILYGMQLQPVWPKDCAHVMLVEGYIDAQRMTSAGFTPCLALGGTAPTTGHVARLKTHSISTVIYVCDGDDSGVQAGERVVDVFAHQGDLDVRLIVLPTGEDPAALLAQPGGRDVMAGHVSGTGI